MYKLINSFDYEKILTKHYKQDAQERIDNIQQIIESCSNFDNKESGVHGFLQQISLVTDKEDKDKKSKIQMMSIHSVKGLEYSICFVVGVEENLLPHGRSLAEDPVGNLEEERRLCYVAFSRAKKHLYVTFCKTRKSFGKHGNIIVRKVIPSRFLFESGLLEKKE
jgi:DNA helicase-2/ATP-dependent DNA helicase PcrA